MVNLSPDVAPSEIVTPFTPVPPGFILGAVTVWNGVLYWTESESGQFWLWSMNPDGTGLQFYGVGPGSVVTKMVGFPYRTGAATFANAIFILASGNLVRFDIDPGNTGPALLATGISDFALRNESAGDLQHSFHFTTIYATIGHLDRIAPPTSPGLLLGIDANTGSTTTVYNSADFDTMNQLFSVTVDTQNVFIAEARIVCSGPPGFQACDLDSYFIKRLVRPSDGGGGLNDVWETIAGLVDQQQELGGDNLRSDGEWWLYYRQGNQIKRIARDAKGIRFAFDLYADHIEVVQTSQDLMNDVRLVTKKPTFARGYAVVTENTTGATPFFPQALLYGTLDGADLPGSPISPINNAMIDGEVNHATRRGDLNRSFLFQLPESWVENSGNLEVKMKINSNRHLHETGSMPNEASSHPMQLIKMGSPCLVLVPIDVTSGPVYWPQDHAVDFGDIINRTRTLLPVEDFQLSLRNDVIRKPVFYILPYPDIVYRSFEFPDNKGAQETDSALTWLTAYYAFEKNPAGCADTHFVGMCPPSVPIFNGQGLRPGPTLLATMRPANSSDSIWQQPRGGFTLAHELTHNYGEHHVYNPASCGQEPSCAEFIDTPVTPILCEDYPYPICTMGPGLNNEIDATYGFDPISNSVITPTNSLPYLGPGDLMSYVKEVWMSKYTIDFLFGHIPGLFFANSAPSLQSFAAPPGSPASSAVILVHGTFNPTSGRAELLPCYQLPRDTFDAGKIAQAMSAVALQLAPRFLIRLSGLDGSTLLETPLVLSAPSDPVLSLGFVQFVAAPPATHRIQLVTSNNVVLADKLVSPNAPALAVEAPVLNAAANTLDLSWTASDADGDPLLFTIQYSPDAGTTWQTVKVGYPFLAATLDTRMLPGSSMAQLRVIATDGFNSTVAVTAAFSLAKHAPVMVLGGVKEGQHLPFGGIGTLTGLALDAEQGSLPRSSLVWDLAGPTPRNKIGGSLSLLDLSPGFYNVSLSATDADSMIGSVTQRFEILPLTVPDRDQAPALDGVCSDPAYAGAAFVRFPMGNGQFAPVRLVHSAGNLYVSFSDLAYAANGTAPSQAGLQIRSAPGAFSSYGSGDAGFYVDQNGTPSTFGPGLAGSRTAVPLPPGFAVVIYLGENSWSAEMQISDSLVGGWDHAAGLMFSQNAANWPPLADPASPLSWASAYFGTPPAPSAAGSLPTANAGANRTYNLVQTESLFLDGSASSDPNAFPLTYAWTQISGPAVSLANPASATPSFVAVSNASTVVLGFQLVVNNGANDSRPAQVQITLQPAPTQALAVPPPIIVTSTSNSETGSLRLAILDAPSGGTITFAPNLSGTITLTSGELAIDKSLTIIGPTDHSITVNGNQSSRVFDIVSDGITFSTVNIANLNITGGQPGSYGGGILVGYNQTLHLNNCTLYDNISNDSGGGIANNGRLTMANCTVSGNQAVQGAGVFTYAGLLVMRNCTVASNRASGAGGGIYTAATIGSSADLSSTLVAGNAALDSHEDVLGLFTSSGYNFIGKTDYNVYHSPYGDTVFTVGLSNGINHDLAGSIDSPMDPRIGPLRDNGGPALTMALLPGSPAIDQGISNGLNTDQRGQTRKFDFLPLANAAGGDGADIGAFEWLECDSLAGAMVTKVAAGIRHSLFLESDGSLWAMGLNEFGELGDSTTLAHETPEQIVSGGVTAIAAGLFHSLFLKSDGSLWAMGANTYGQLGDGTLTDRATPVQIVPNNVTAIAAGFYQSMFLKSDGSLWAMGFNIWGQLGDGTYAEIHTPKQIVSSGVTAIAVGFVHSLFLKSDGSVWGMGYNGYGELGDGTTLSITQPKQVMPGSVTAISAGELFSLFLKSDGSVWAVGDNRDGQLGDGTTDDTSAPEKIMSSGVTAIAAGGFYGSYDSFFLKSDGSLWGTGYNAYGQLGDGTTNDTHYPMQIVSSGVTAMTAGYGHTLFVESDGSLWGMGYNYGGPLGDGTSTDRHTPEPVVVGVPSCGFRITSVARVGSDLQISFTSQAGHTYNILSTSDLAAGPWTRLQTGVLGNGGTVQVLVAHPQDPIQPRQFFRIQQAQ